MNIADAAAAPRMHHQWYPDVLQLESGFSPDTIRILRARGHEIRFTPAMSSLQIAMFRDGLFYGYSDPRRPGAKSIGWVLFFTLNREDFSFVIHLDRQPRTSRRREAQTGSRARSGSRSERTLDAVEHSRTLMEWWPFLIFHRGGLRIKVINNSW